MKHWTFVKRKSFLVRCGLLLLFPFVTEAQSLSLPDILDSITLNNQGLQQYALHMQGNAAESQAVKSWAAPTVGLGLSEFPYGNSSKMDKMMARKMPMLRIQQMFPNFAKQRAESKYYQSLSLQDKDQRQIMKNLLFARAKKAYYDAVIIEKKKTIIGEQRRQLRLLIKMAKERLAYNKADLPTIYHAQSRLSEIKSQIIHLESASKQALSLLNTLMNRAPNASMTIDTSLIVPLSEDRHLLPDTSYVSRHRSRVQLLHHRMKSMHWQQQSLLAEAQPTFGLSWDNMRMSGNIYSYSLMATVSIPMVPWVSKGYHSKVKALGYRIQSVRKKKEYQVSKIIGAVYNTRMAMKAQREELENYRQEILPAFRKAYQANLHAFRENEGDIYRTLMAWNDMTKKRLLYLDKLKKLLDLSVKLQQELEQYK